jgi:hypothetical protein
VVNGVNMAKIEENLRKIECDSRNKIKVAQMYQFCEKVKLCMQPLKRPTNAPPVRISYTISGESSLH